MGTNFDRMTHDEIYAVITAGAPGPVSVAADELAGLNTKISGHLDTLDQLSRSMADAWPDQNGQNFRSTLADTIGYLRELQATHVIAASSSVTQVMSASHEKLAQTQATIPPPPAVPVAAQEKVFSKHLSANHDAMNAGTAAELRQIAAGKAADARAVLLAKSLANLYLAETAKLSSPPAAPKGPSNNGSGSGTPTSGSSGTSSSHAMGNYSATGGSGGSSAGLVANGTSGGSSGTGAGHPATFAPVHHGGVDGSQSGSGADGSAGGQVGSAHGGTLLDPSANGGALYDANGNLIGGTGYDASPAGFDGSSVSGVLGGAGAMGGGSSGGGSGFGAGAFGAVGVGLVGAGVIAARKEAAQRASQQAALLKGELLSEEELAAGGAGGSLTSSQLAAINAQRNGILAAGQQAGLMSGERTMLTQQSGLLRANAVMTAQEEAQLAANQRLVPGQLGGAPATAAATGARSGMPFAGGGVVGGAERVTWLVEDRDLFSADPGVRAVIED